MSDEIAYPATMADDGGHIQQMAQQMISEMESIFHELDTLFMAAPAPLAEAMSDWYGQLHIDVMSMSSYWYQIGTNVTQAAQNMTHLDQQLAHKIDSQAQ